jgi:hypothetical protein
MNLVSHTDQEIGQGSLDAKPTMQDLWRRHPEIQNAAHDRGSWHSVCAGRLRLLQLPGDTAGI